jgi:hypothetical protein
MPGRVEQIIEDDPQIIAPCGINCSLCRGYTRDRNPCPGCRGGVENKAPTCLHCAIKNCEELAAGGYEFCYSCDSFPCAKLLHLDLRYRTRYRVSVIANLERIQSVGADRFVDDEAAKWACPECGERLCMHKPQCINCGYTW